MCQVGPVSTHAQRMLLLKSCTSRLLIHMVHADAVPADRLVEVRAGICVGLYEKLINLEAEFLKKT
jgi:hypothetical protein